jgi:hypothetical protein
VRLRGRHPLIIALIPVALLFGCTKSSPTAPTASNCTYALSATTVSVGAAGGPTSLTVTTGNACVWTGLTGSSFITMTSAAGITGSGNLTFTVAANTGAARTGTVTAGGQTVTVNQAAGTTPQPPAANDAIFGNWAGTITMTVGCVPALPLTYTWTGVIRAGGATGTELLITVPNTPISGQVFPVTLTNNSISFSVPFDSLYTFTGTVGSDRRSIPTGSFTGTNCRPTGTAVLPSGTWTGIHQ